jgi:hypothetical protein
MNFGDKRKSGERDSSLYEHREHWESPFEPVPHSPSKQDFEIQRLRSDGLTVREIAQILNLRPSEVKRCLGLDGGVGIEVDGFEGVDFSSSQADHSTVDRSSYDTTQGVVYTPERDVPLETRRGYLEYITEITGCQGGDEGGVCEVARDVINWKSLSKPILDELFEVQGYRCVSRSEGRKSLRAMADLVKGWSILDFDFTKIECHPVYYDLMEALGYPEGDLFVWFRLAKYKCSSCGTYVYKTHVCRSVTAGRVHPLLALSRCKRRAFMDYRRFLLVVHELLRRGVFNYRDGRFVRVYDKSLSLICLDLTVPDGVSTSLRDVFILRLEYAKDRYGFDLVGELRDKHVLNRLYGYIFADIVKAMKSAFIRAFKDVVKAILEKEEGLKIKGDIMLGGKVNCHIWSSGWLTPHFHLHTNFLNVVRVKVDGVERFVRFKPKLSDWALRMLKDRWRVYLRAELFKIEDFRVWGNEMDFESDFVVHSQFIELDLEEDGDFVHSEKILHRFRYVSRSPLLDLNIALHDGRIVVKDAFGVHPDLLFGGKGIYAVKDGLHLIDFRWLMVLALYQNRSQSFGFIHSCIRVFGITDSDLVRLLKSYKGASKTEYCMLCGSKLEFVGYLSLMDFLREGNPFVITFYYNGYRRFEFWKKRGVDPLPALKCEKCVDS